MEKWEIRNKIGKGLTARSAFCLIAMCLPGPVRAAGDLIDITTVKEWRLQDAAKLWGMSYKKYGDADGLPSLPGSPYFIAGESRTAGRAPEAAKAKPGNCIGYWTQVMPGAVDAGGTSIPRISIVDEDQQGISGAMKDIKAGQPVTSAIMWGWKHGSYSATDLAIPYIQELLNLGRPGKTISVQGGWLGDLQKATGEFPYIASYGDYKGDKSKASWLPNRYVAYVWRAYCARHPTKKKIGHASETGLSAPPDLEVTRPAASYRLNYNTPAAITTDQAVTCEIRSPYKDIKTVELYDGDQKLTELKGNTYGIYQFSGARFGKSKVYALLAVATRQDGSMLTSRPALLYVSGPDRNVPFLSATALSEPHSLQWEQNHGTGSVLKGISLGLPTLSARDVLGRSFSGQASAWAVSPRLSPR